MDSKLFEMGLQPFPDLCAASVAADGPAGGVPEDYQTDM